MPCDPDELRHVPLFELLDDDEARVLAAQVEIRRFQPRERIFKVGDPPEDRREHIPATKLSTALAPDPLHGDAGRGSIARLPCADDGSGDSFPSA